MKLVAQWLPLLLCCWAGSAAAAADCAPSSGTFTINGPDDITTLNQCTTLTGNVTVAAKGIEDVTLNGLKAVTGILQIQDVDAVLSISSTTLESVQTLTLNNLPKLTTLTLPALTNFTKLDFSGLTTLKGCEIATGALKHDVSEISIINTALERMDWLKWPVATTLTIAANMKLTDFSFPYNKISAGSSYQISINEALVNLDFSQLSGIYGSLAINGNNDSSLNFDKLETIDGYVRLSGPFTNITMPHLTGINGALRAESTRDILSFCNWLSVQNRLFGHYDCTANSTSPVTSSTTSKSPSNSAGSTTLATGGTSGGGSSGNHNKSDLSTGAIIGIAVAMVIISIGLTSAALFFFRRGSRKRTEQAQESAIADDKKTHSTSTLGEELDASGIHYELGGGKTVTELPGAGPVRELDGESLQELDCPKPYFKDHKPAPDSPIGRFELP